MQKSPKHWDLDLIKLAESVAKLVLVMDGVVASTRSSAANADAEAIQDGIMMLDSLNSLSKRPAKAPKLLGLLLEWIGCPSKFSSKLVRCFRSNLPCMELRLL